MASGSETPLKPRRPTAFEVSFPNEYDDGHEEEYEDAVDEGNDPQISRHNGKRKLDSNTNTVGSDGRPAKRRSHQPPTGVNEEKELFYTPRPDELPESAPGIAFLLGEDDAPSPADVVAEGTEGDKKPVRVLHDWSIFDARPRPRKQGDLAFPMLSLDALEKSSSVCAPEGAGVAAPLFENDEDAGQEDDGDDYDECEGEEECSKAVSVRLRLGALLRYTIDYTKRDDPIFIETTAAWYILGLPAREYRAHYAPFFRAHKIAQALVCALINDASISFEAFINDLEASAVTGSSGTCTANDIQDAIPAIHAAVDTLDESSYRVLRDAPLLQLVLNVSGISRGTASPLPMRRAQTRQGQGPSVPPRSTPFRLLPSTIGNLDLAVLRPENQRPTHVTPRIAALAAGLFREQLVVLGRRPSAVTRRSGGSVTWGAKPKEERSALLRAIAMALCPEGTQSIEAPTRWRLHPRQPFMERVGLVHISGLVSKTFFEVGNVVVVPIGEDSMKRGHVPVTLPLKPEAAPRDSRLADYFWFGRIVHINGEDERVHLQWFDHAPNTFLDDIADPRELFLTPLCDTLPLISLCGTVHVEDFTAHDSVPDDYDGYFFRFMYDKTDASFSEPLPAPPPTDPPHNCAVCARREEEQIEAHGRIVRRAGSVVGVAVHGTTFHVGDYALVRAEKGPSRIAQLVGVFSSDPVWVKLQLLGRVSDLGLANILPPDELRDERHLFFTDEFEEAPVENLLEQCYVLHQDLIFDLDLWATLGPAHFYYRYRFKKLMPESWDERMFLEEDAGIGCETCAYALQTRLAEVVAFEEEAQVSKLRVLDVFAGAGAMSLGMETGTSGIKTTHAIEVGPSAARTFRRNSPGTIVYNQCANEVLRYAVKSHRGLLAGDDSDVPKDVYDKSRLPSPPRPGDIDVIVAGFPCQPHSQLNMFQKANDVKSNLILNLLSWVDFLEPAYCVFENVRGFLSYNLRAVQLDEHRTAGGIDMGGLKFLVHAMLAMNYQVRFCLLQAAHYGTPQTRVRFFLFAARRGYPLPAAPKPTHDFPPTNRLEVRFPNGDIARAVHAEPGIAPFRFVSIDDAISDLPRFDWMNPSLRRLSAQKRDEARERAAAVPTLVCDQAKKHVGFKGPVVSGSGTGLRYHHPPRTSFQAWCRKRRTDDLQHFTQALKPGTVERVVNIPLVARADYRSLERDLWEWQFSDPASAIARKGFRPGLYGRLDKDFVFQTTVTNVQPTAKQSRVLNPYCHRMVTVRELARSQGFPDSFIFHSINSDVVTMHRQIGNAVPWPVAAAIGRELREARMKKWRKDRQSNAMDVE